MTQTINKKVKPTSTVGRGKSFSSCTLDKTNTNHWNDKNINLFCGNSLNLYKDWETPTTIISDGAYGILGFEGDTSTYNELQEWYEPHIIEWSKAATAQTTLWFWNTEIGWATVHPILEKNGWKYINCNTWNKGKGHIAGNVNTAKIRRFPVASEVCAHYVYEAKINDLTLQEWLRAEWKRSKLPMNKANEACGVKAAAVRKYLDNSHLWYFPPKEMFEKMANYANTYGDQNHKPYFSIDGKNIISAEEWGKMRAKFYCPHGYTNVWERSALRGKERVKAPKKAGKAAHLNQKPLDLMRLLIEASTDQGDTVWEPFGGLFSASLAAKFLNRKAFSSELDHDYFTLGVQRFKNLQV